MAIKQLTVFVQNRKGTIVSVTDILAKNNINMRALSLADASDFGIARIIVDNPDEVAEVLKANDYIVKSTKVIAIEIPDESGSLNKILKLLAENGRNLEYMYGFTGKKTNTACMIIRCTDNDATVEILQKANIHLINQEELVNI